MPSTAPQPRALRPRDIAERFGIPASTLHYYCTKIRPEHRLPSIKLPGKLGTNGKGKRLVFEHELLSWMERYRQK